MNALILDASPEGQGPLNGASDTVERTLSEAGIPVERLRLRDMNIIHCCGNFDCWIKTPGVCSARDDGRRIGSALIKTDLLVVVTRVSFGGFSALAKSAMDRCIPSVLPFLENYSGEIHHPLRGGRVKSLAVIGGLAESDPPTESIFRGLVGRNALNMRSPAHTVEFLYDSDDERSVDAAVARALAGAGVTATEVAV